MALCSSFLQSMSPLNRKYQTLLELSLLVKNGEGVKVDRAFFDFMMLNREHLHDPSCWMGGVVVPNKPHLSFDVSLPFKTTNNAELKIKMMEVFLELAHLLLTEENIKAAEKEGEVVRNVRESMLNDFQLIELYNVSTSFAFLFDSFFSTIDETDVAFCSEILQSEAVAQTVQMMQVNEVSPDNMMQILPLFFMHLQKVDKSNIQRLSYKIGVLLQDPRVSSNVVQFLREFQRSHPEFNLKLKEVLPQNKGDIDLGTLFLENIDGICKNLKAMIP